MQSRTECGECGKCLINTSGSDLSDLLAERKAG